MMMLANKMCVICLSSSHDLIGSCETSLRALSQYGRSRHEFDVS